MGKQGLAAFLSEPRFEGLPATLETPGPDKKGADKKEVQAAKRLRKAGLKRRRRERTRAWGWLSLMQTPGSCGCGASSRTTSVDCPRGEATVRTCAYPAIASSMLHHGVGARESSRASRSSG